MSLKVVSGTVLNQDTNNPMSGEIVGRTGMDLRVRWDDGRECTEDPGDVVLTGNVEFGEV